MVSEIFRTYVAGYLSPTAFLGLFLLTGLIHLFKKNNSRSRVLLSLGVGFYFLFTLSPMKQILYSLTEAPPTKPEGSYEYVVVLGARVFPDNKVPLSSQLGPSIMSRLVYGISLLNQNPGAKLVVSGNGAGEVAEADLLKAQAIQLGVKPEQIITDNLSMNTKDHGKYLLPVLKGKKFLIVTSAYHMARAKRNFETYNLQGAPAPTDFANKTNFGTESFIPRGENLSSLDRWMTEMYSKIWTEIRLLFS